MSAPVVLVTGCSAGGLGFFLCLEFAKRGCKVYATARDVRKMEGLPAAVELRALDVTQDADVQRVVREVVAREGRIDVLVNNAGVQYASPLLDVPIDELTRTFDANVYSVLRTVQAAVPPMAAAKRGLVINIGSVSGQIATPWAGAYNASKAAMNSLSDTLDMELRPLGVRVLLVALGGVRSHLATNAAASARALPAGTLYAAFRAHVAARLQSSQGAEAMPTDAAARRIVAAALQPTPPRYLSFGGKAGAFYILRWLPRSVVLWLMWARFSRWMRV